MGRLGVVMAGQLSDAVLVLDHAGVAAMDRADARVDELEAQLLAAISAGTGGYDRSTVVDVTLLARFYERFADQAVSVRRRLDFIITAAPAIAAMPERAAATG